MYLRFDELVVDVGVVLDDVVAVAELEAVVDGAIGFSDTAGATTIPLFADLEPSTPPIAALTVIVSEVDAGGES